MSGPGALLRVEGLRTWFPIRRGILQHTVGWVRAVDDVSFEVVAGRTLALVGESGCGKTTVGLSILRLVEPQAGRVLFDGDDLAALPDQEMRARRRAIQIVFQDPLGSLDPRMRVRDAIAEGMQSFGIGAERVGAHRSRRRPPRAGEARPAADVALPARVLRWSAAEALYRPRSRRRAPAGHL